MKAPFCATILSSLIAMTLLFCATLTFGQGIVTGSISGSVQDPQGAVVAGATITATQISTNRQYTAQTGKTGLFAINVLPPGQYDIRIDAASFRSYESNAVTVAVGKDTSLGGGARSTD